MRRPRGTAFSFVELLVVILALAGIAAALLAILSQMRKSEISQKLATPPPRGELEMASTADYQARRGPGAGLGGGPAPIPQSLAHIKTFDAAVALIPRLSIGTATAESIYEVKLDAKMTAAQAPGRGGESEIVLPLPPQLISLANLNVKVNGDPSENVSLRNGKLVWRGSLGSDPLPIHFTYSAVGKGLYALEVPPGGILDKFNLTLTAEGSDVRLLEMSMQPAAPVRNGNTTTYTWNYERLMLGLPIAIDVLGIAPIDRLGDLGWLGPVGVVLFGLLVGMAMRAFQVERFDLWMLLLVIGTFTAAYPLMYFAQAFMPLKTAVLLGGGLALLIIAARTVPGVGVRLALAAVVLPAAAIMALTLLATVQPSYRGLILTIEGVVLFVVATTLMPRLGLGETAGALAVAGDAPAPAGA